MCRGYILVFIVIIINIWGYAFLSSWSKIYAIHWKRKKALKRFDFLKYKLFSCKNSEVVLWISTPHQFVVPQLQVRNEERNIRKAINKNTEKTYVQNLFLLRKLMRNILQRQKYLLFGLKFFDLKKPSFGEQCSST